MSLLPEVRDELEAAARQRVRQRRRGAGARRRFAGALGPGIAVLATATVIAVMLVSLHGGGHGGRSAARPPQPGGSPRPTAATERAMQAAQNQVQAHDRACRLVPETGPAQFAAGAPPSALRKSISVFDRPARGAERVGRAELARHFGGDWGLYAAYARRGHSDGVPYELVPVRADRPFRPAPARCGAEEVAAFRRLAHRLSPPQQELGARELRGAFSAAGRPGVCLWEDYSREPSTSCDAGAEPLDDVGAGATNTADHVTVYPTVVPDTVATVTAQLTPADNPHAVGRTITRRVTGNVVIFVIRGNWDPPSFVLRSASGRVLWTTPSR